MRRIGDRGVSNVVGAMLLLAIVIAGAGAITVAGNDLATEQRSEAAAEMAETNLETLRSDISATAYEPRDHIETTLPRKDLAGSLGVKNSGHITVEVGSPSSGWTTKVDEDLGYLGIETDETLVAYQAGGVWRRAVDEPESAEIVHAPAITAVSRDSTSLTVPIFLVEGDVDLSGNIKISKTDEERIHEPLFIPSGDAVRITIDSKFADAWARYFDETIPESNRVLRHNPGTETVELTYGMGRSEDIYLHGVVHSMSVDDT